MTNNDYNVRTNITDAPESYEDRKADDAARIAKTIIDQLGGNRFAAMTGAKHFVALGNGVQFSIGRNAKSVNKVVIRLNAFDTYDVEFLRIAGTRSAVKGYVEGVYADQLRTIFESETGLATSL